MHTLASMVTLATSALHSLDLFQLEPVGRRVHNPNPNPKTSPSPNPNGPAPELRPSADAYMW